MCVTCSRGSVKSNIWMVLEQHRFHTVVTFILNVTQKSKQKSFHKRLSEKSTFEPQAFTNLATALKSSSITNCYIINNVSFSVVSTHWVGYVHTDWLYLQHLTNKRGLKKHHTEEESTIGSEAQLRWELLECKWVPTSLENNTINRHRFSSRVTCRLLGQRKTAERKRFHWDKHQTTKGSVCAGWWTDRKAKRKVRMKQQHSSNSGSSKLINETLSSAREWGQRDA